MVRMAVPRPFVHYTFKCPYPRRLPETVHHQLRRAQVTPSSAGWRCSRSTAMSTRPGVLTMTVCAPDSPATSAERSRSPCSRLGVSTGLPACGVHTHWSSRGTGCSCPARSGCRCCSSTSVRGYRCSTAVSSALTLSGGTHRPDLGLHAVRGVVPRIETEVGPCQLDAACRALRNDPALVRDVGAISDPAVSRVRS